VLGFAARIDGPQRFLCLLPHRGLLRPICALVSSNPLKLKITKPLRCALSALLIVKREVAH
jgi:hypothetical protein